MSSNRHRQHINEYEDDGENDQGYHEFDNEDDSEEDQDAHDAYQRQQKRPRLDNLAASYVVQNSPADWSAHEIFVLLEVWGDRFLQLGRKSLRSDDWLEVAEKVSEATKVGRSDAHCRSQLDALKKKYRKEKAKMEEMGGKYVSRWVSFKKMDMLLNSSSPTQQWGLACGVDSGEYVFMNPNVYLNRSNGLDEMRDSPGESESDDEDDDEDGERLRGEKDDDRSSSFRLLADSIQKFGQLYEKIEHRKRQQTMELEKMRMDFQRELELQKKQILDRAQVEIAKIRQGDEEETDVSAENFSG